MKVIQISDNKGRRTYLGNNASRTCFEVLLEGDIYKKWIVSKTFATVTWKGQLIGFTSTREKGKDFLIEKCRATLLILTVVLKTVVSLDSSESGSSHASETAATAIECQFNVCKISSVLFLRLLQFHSWILIRGALASWAKDVINLFSNSERYLNVIFL